MAISRPGATGLALFLGGAGALHFAAPDFFDRIIPGWLPGAPRAWTYGSGVAEVAVAGLVAHPRTRRRGALAAAALFVAVFPANITFAQESRNGSALVKALAFGRLPLQVPLVLWARAVARDVPARPG